MKEVNKIQEKEIIKVRIILMRKFFSAIFLLILTTSCEIDFSDFSDFDDDSPPTTESLRINRVELDLKGSVKSYHLMVYKAIEDSGNITEGEIIGSNISLFNDDGNKTEFTSYNASGELNNKIIYNYNINGKHIETITSDFYGNINSDNYEYDSNGNIIEWSHLDSNGNPPFKTIYIFDNNNNNIEVYESSSSTTWLIFLNEFDTQGNKIKEDRYDYYGTEKGEIVYKYDGIGNAIERGIYISGEGLSHKSSFKYNVKRNIIEELDLFSRYGSNTRSKHIYKYDAKDNLLERFRYSLNDIIEYRNAYKYEYDVPSNWVTKLEIVNNVTEFITKREIEYFNN